MRFPSVAPRAPPPGSAGSPGPDVRRWKGLAPHRGRLLTNVPSAEWAKCLQDAESAQDAPAGPGETGGAPPWPSGDADGSSGPPAERLAALGVRSAATLILGFKRVETSTRRMEGSGGGAACPSQWPAPCCPSPEPSPAAKCHWDFCSLLRKLIKESVTLECWLRMGHFLLQISHDLLGTGYNRWGGCLRVFTSL